MTAATSDWPDLQFGVDDIKQCCHAQQMVCPCNVHMQIDIESSVEFGHRLHSDGNAHSDSCTPQCQAEAGSEHGTLLTGQR